MTLNVQRPVQRNVEKGNKDKKRLRMTTIVEVVNMDSEYHGRKDTISRTQPTFKLC